MLPTMLLLWFTLLLEHSHAIRVRTNRPNIILFITDDQDVELGSVEFMQHVLDIFRMGGAEFVNGFVTTPICCPSRTSLLTGKYWKEVLEHRTFPVLLRNSGYRTGYFGKYLNEYDGSYIPPGWDDWLGLIKNSRFYNYTVNFNGRKMKHGHNYYDDYFTDLIVNDSITFLKRSVRLYPFRPLLMVLSFPAPHGPEDPAPQYSLLFPNSTTHRTPSWNYAPNPDKQWLLRHTGKMEPVHVAFTDFLHRRRLQTLMSVDDAVFKLYKEVVVLGLHKSTYFIYTSDHGYHLGQFGLIKGKTMPYDFDLKVPFFVRGPGIAGALRVFRPVGNIDIAPTILDMAALSSRIDMDGRSFLPLLRHETAVHKGLTDREFQWRHSILIERGLRPKLIRLRERFKKQRERYGKDARIQLECEKPEYKAPCQKYQQWECRKNEVGRWRIFKCRDNVAVNQRCLCRDLNLTEAASLNGAKPASDVFIKAVVKRSTNSNVWLVGKTTVTYFSQQNLYEWEQGDQFYSAFVPEAVVEQWERDFFSEVLQGSDDQDGNWRQGIFGAYAFGYAGARPPLEDLRVKADEVEVKRRKRNFDFWPDIKKSYSGFKLNVDDVHEALAVRGCVLFSNNTAVCRPEVFVHPKDWRQQKHVVDDKIRILRHRLHNLKDLRKHLKEGRPDSQLLSFTPSHWQPEVDRSHSIAEFSTATNHDIDGYIDDDVVTQVCSCHVVSDRDPANHPLKRLRQSEMSDADLLQLAERDGRLRSSKKRTRSKVADKSDKRRKGKVKHDDCNVPNLNCFTHDNSHWRTEPYWTLGPFCFCQNSYNNSYWCLRTVNSTHNFLYCEFITGFLSFYDMTKDKYQLHNIVYDLSIPVIEQLSSQLENLRKCHGVVECESYGKG